LNIPFDRIAGLLQHDVQWRTGAQERRPTEVELFLRFAAANGPACPLARASLKRFYTECYTASGTEFLEAVSKGKWPVLDLQVE